MMGVEMDKDFELMKVKMIPYEVKNENKVFVFLNKFTVCCNVSGFCWSGNSNTASKSSRVELSESVKPSASINEF